MLIPQKRIMFAIIRYLLTLILGICCGIYIRNFEANNAMPKHSSKIIFEKKGLIRSINDKIKLRFPQINQSEAAELRVEKIYSLIQNGEIKKAYIYLEKCKEYEKDHNIYFGNESQSSCISEEIWILNTILEPGRCCFMDIFYSDELTYEQKMRFIRRLEETVKSQHDIE